MTTGLYWVRADGQLMVGAMLAPNWLLDDEGRLPDGDKPPRQHAVVDAPDLLTIEETT